MTFENAPTFFITYLKVISGTTTNWDIIPCISQIIASTFVYFGEYESPIM